MRYFTITFLSAFASISTCNPLTTRGVTQFPAGTKFDIVLQSAKVTLQDFKNSPIQVLDIDLFDNYNTDDNSNNIKALTQAGKTVICYFSAGSRENWRLDAKDFKRGDYGKKVSGWRGESWLNLKSANVKTIMAKRIQLAKAAGCSAIDPDNVDGYSENQDGFGYDKSVYSNYVKWLGETASSAGLAMGLKNAQDIIPDVIDSVQFAVNEQCHQYKECATYAPFKAANKAVFAIEYKSKDCSSPAGTQLSTILKPLALDKLGGQC